MKNKLIQIRDNIRFSVDKNTCSYVRLNKIEVQFSKPLGGIIFPPNRLMENQIKNILKDQQLSANLVEILHSIKSISIENGELCVRFFDRGDEPFGIQEYRPESFTRELLELIEAHLNR